jgi:CheY-like chemotaxis protein
MASPQKTVLVADDERRWREYAKDMLSDEFQVETVNDCESVLARADAGGIDLLVLDHLMPGTAPFDTRFHVCRYFKEENPGPPIILFTGGWEGASPDRSELEKTSGARVVFKEVHEPSRDDLAMQIRQLLV